MPRDKSRYRDKRSSSYSSDSSYDRKKSKSSHRRRSRSRSRDRSVSSNYKRKRSTSRSRHKRRSYSRSLSRDRYESKSRRRSSSRSKRSKESYSRDRSKSRSRSRSRRHKKSKKSGKKSRSSSSRSNSTEIERPIPPKPGYSEDEAKLEKAIKAAEAAGLTLTKIPTYEYKEVTIKEDMPTIQDRNLIAELNSDTFVQKSFTSSRSKKQSNIVIDLNAQTVKIPDSDVKVQKDDSILNLNELPSEEELKEMWIKKLYQFRKKMLRGEI